VHKIANLLNAYLERLHDCGRTFRGCGSFRPN
jgi:hypothetical protein